LFDQPLVAAAEDFFEQGLQHEESEMRAGRDKSLNFNIGAQASCDAFNTAAQAFCDAPKTAKWASRDARVARP
jgi:hypothetical protein